ncbi:AfsR/SARP family transcriptional regulator [Solihabitans fulvus]|uniref:AfsR/SARP family transcriptional regulator n=1 Tax=Solihabitans fulvus TaxID=1892852 RepID=A0A5B2XHS4_9PSEU|nr:AfsR/SARP family transcriptional regulator [Solihabitans fulvus]KAA2262579.1 AfsR/SARP family transcriptional regulator [Solihabitans fulvus]
MDIRVLGPLRISCADMEVVPTARKPRQLLALLLLNYSRVVPMGMLIDELWDGHAPKTALAAVQTYVFHLRKKLAEVTGESMDTVGNEILRTARNGYEVVAELGCFDLRVFHRLERAGMAVMAEGDLHTAAQNFREALSLWRGPALADVAAGPGIRAEVAGLEQSRATMLDHRIELELRLGLHREILSELAVLVSHDRFHEDRRAQFIIALYRSGYRVRALEAFHQLRKDMITEFGVEPSPKLHQYYQAVLTSDPALDRMPVLPLPRSSELPVLPAVAGSF